MDLPPVYFHKVYRGKKIERVIYLFVGKLSTRAVFTQDIHDPVGLSLVCGYPYFDSVHLASLGSCSPCSLKFHFLPFFCSNRCSLGLIVSPSKFYFNFLYAVHSGTTLERDRN